MQSVASSSKQQLPARQPSQPRTPHASTPASDSRPRWMQYGGYYRQIEDITQPWIPSPRVSTSMPVPNVPVFDINLHYKAGEVSSLNSSSSSSTWSPVSRPSINAQLRTPATQNTSLPKKRFASLRKIAGKLSVRRTKPGRDLAREAPPAVVVEKPPVGDHWVPPYVLATRVQPHEWKDWGYYARPTINYLTVHNSSSPPQYYAPLQHIDETDLTPEDVFYSLRDPDGTPHPERWKLGMQHPSLPPRPARWSPPDPLQPLPFPWEVQINPFLEHKLFGCPRMYWNIKEDITAAMYGLEIDEDPDMLARPLNPADLAQPATWPFVTHMYVNALSDDISPKFAWPFMVINPDGVKIRDIVNFVHANFQEYISADEFYSWTVSRRKEATRAYKLRTDPNEHLWKYQEGEMDPEDRMRRIDYLGEKTLFRGLGPNPDGTGWVLYLGQD